MGGRGAAADIGHAPVGPTFASTRYRALHGSGPEPGARGATPQRAGA